MHLGCETITQISRCIRLAVLVDNQARSHERLEVRNRHRILRRSSQAGGQEDPENSRIGASVTEPSNGSDGSVLTRHCARQPGNAGDRAGGEVAGFLGFAGAVAVGAVADEGAGGEDFQQERGEGEFWLVRDLPQEDLSAPRGELCPECGFVTFVLYAALRYLSA
jgi:hypothetical protein